MKEKSIVATATLVTSLLSYLYAREADRDTVPYVMLGGFLGSLIGEGIVESMNRKKSENQNLNNGNKNF